MTFNLYINKFNSIYSKFCDSETPLKPKRLWHISLSDQLGE